MTQWRNMVQHRAVELAEAIGRSIRAQRTQQGMTQRALATACGVSPVTAWRWETGRQMPSPKHLTQITQALGLDLAALLKELS